MMPRKEDELALFTQKTVEELFILYKPLCSLLLEKTEPRSPLTHQIILHDLELELSKAIRLYQNNHAYLESYRFSSYYFAFFKKYINRQIDRGLLRLKGKN